MGKLTIHALRVIIALSLVGSLIVLGLIVPALWRDLEELEVGLQIGVTTIAVIAVVAMQVFAVCVWQLLTLVRRDAVFSSASFRYVNVIIAAILVAAVDVFVLAVLLALGEAAPGIVGILCGFTLVLGGMALLMVVMKNLLRQAIDRDGEARHLRSELEEVI